MRIWTMLVELGVLLTGLIIGTGASIFVAGFALGIIVWIAVDWWIEHKFSKQIMKEIDTLTRFHDQNQLNLFGETND